MPNFKCNWLEIGAHLAIAATAIYAAINARIATASAKRRAQKGLRHHATLEAGESGGSRNRGAPDATSSGLGKRRARPGALPRAPSQERTVAEYPEHGTGRTAPLATCGHCGGKPLIVRRCPRDAEPAKFCAVCQKCGHHHEVIRDHPQHRAEQAQALLELRQVKAIVGRTEATLVRAIAGAVSNRARAKASQR